MQGTQIAFEFHLSFQKMREHQLIDSFSLLAEFLHGFLCSLFVRQTGDIWIWEFSKMLKLPEDNGKITKITRRKEGRRSRWSKCAPYLVPSSSSWRNAGKNPKMAPVWEKTTNSTELDNFKIPILHLKSKNNVFMVFMLCPF